MNPYHHLETQITALAQSAISSSLSDQQKADLRQGLKLAHGWTWPAGRMKKLIATIPEETLKAFMSELLTTDSDQDIDYYLQRCLHFLNDNSLLALSGFSTADIAAASFRAHGLTQATALQSEIDKESRLVWKESWIEITYFAHQFLEILVSLIGINEVTRQKHQKFSQENGLSSMEANAKLDSYKKLIATIVTVFGFIYSYIKLKTPAAFLTLMASLVAVVTILYHNRHWKPCPIDHQGLKNLSMDLLRENHPIYARQDVLKRIELAFEAGRGVLLVGSSGAGKSRIAYSFAQQISAGKICTFIKKPQVFTCNSSRLGQLNYDGASLTSIEDRFRRHSAHVIFFFDEFHALFKETQALGNQTGDGFKTFRDEFKYVIGATTTEEYRAHIAGKPAIADDRFEIIHVDPMDRDETRMALFQHLQGKNSKIAFDPSIIDDIIDKANTFNPKISHTRAAYALLDCAIEKINSVAHRALEGYVARLENELRVLEQRLINERVGLHLHELSEQLVAKNGELQRAMKELETSNHRTQRMQKMEAYHLNLRRQSYRLAKPGIALDEGSELAQKWIKLHARISMIGQCIAKERQSLGLPYYLDKALIESILAERA